MQDSIKFGLWVRFTDDGIPAWFGPAWVDGAEFVEGVTGETLITHRRVDGEWVLREPVKPTDPEPPEPDPEALDEARKFAGVEFEGVMCSAMKADQDGLVAVLLSIQMQGAAFPPTLFHFANGSRLVISLANYQALIATWLPFRQSFFRV
jgi:hypothetical protein